MKNNKLIFTMFMLLSMYTAHAGQPSAVIALKASEVVYPLEEVIAVLGNPGIVKVYDGKGKLYVSAKAGHSFAFQAGGALGTHTIVLEDRRGRVLGKASFTLDAETTIDDGGDMSGLFAVLRAGLFNVGNGRGYGQVRWNGDLYRYYVPWDLDHNSVMNGMQYFLPYGGEFTDLLRETQRKDGMIWSFVRQDNESRSESAYYETAYGSLGFFRRDGNVFFARQPVDNHSDYNYVNQFYKHWKASGDDAWMKKTIESALLALDYCFTDSLRWSERFQLLKRPYCIDSWDFQVQDEYTPEAPIAPSMVVIPGKTKFGVFFGDNTGYFEACNQAAEMLDHLGQAQRALAYRERGQLILENLLKVSWNGRHFTHFVDEDPSVVRNLGVDEKSQIAQGNMYSLNRGLPLEINRAIIETYLGLRKNLPEGSPGEWYAIYPPFGRGFGSHNSQWQYMNGGVAGHAIGEMARGAYESGYEDYASDVMFRMYELAKKHGNRLYFSYTGKASSVPPPPEYTTVDISQVANMDLWDKGANGVYAWMNETREGNDMRYLPTGQQLFNGITFNVTDPGLNGRRSAVAVSFANGMPEQTGITINSKAGAIYLLHAVSGAGQVAGSVSLSYDDGTVFSQYIMNSRDVTGWWFPALQTERSGLAWYGPNPVSTNVGVCWTAIDNPFPEKTIKSLEVQAAVERGIYAILGITLSDSPHFVPSSPISYGGPDNWTSGNGMGALVEGLAGVQNLGLAFDRFRLVPRWTTAGIDSANVVVRFAASNGYVAYRYKYLKEQNRIDIQLTGSGKHMKGSFIVPNKDQKPVSVLVNGESLPFSVYDSGGYPYVEMDMDLNGIKEIQVSYTD